MSSVLAIKVCTQHLQFKHQNGDERRKAGELQRGGRQEGGKRARLFSALPPVGCQASFGLCRSVVEGDQDLLVGYPQLISEGEQRFVRS